MAHRPGTQKTITVVGAHYVDFIIWDLLAKSFDAYQKLDFSKRRFQTSTWEHSHASAAIVLTTIGIESYRNWLCYSEKFNVGRSATDDLCTVLARRNTAFPRNTFKQWLTEIFVLRDVIAHNHLYEVTVSYDEKWAMSSLKQRLLEGYGDQKFEECVNPETRTTKLLRLNVQPAKVGFEDIFKVLVILDLMVGVTQELMGLRLLRLDCQKDGYDFRNLSEILTYYLDRSPNRNFQAEVEKCSATLRNVFGTFLPSRSTGEWFITNTCPGCSAIGFRKRPDLSNCHKCGLTIQPRRCSSRLPACSAARLPP